MPVNQQMYQLGAKRNIMREIFEHGKRRAAVIGVVFQFLHHNFYNKLLLYRTYIFCL